VCTARAFQNEITHIIASVSKDEIYNVSQNLFTRWKMCFREESGLL
jgi:hypothetical protein